MSALNDMPYRIKMAFQTVANRTRVSIWLRAPNPMMYKFLGQKGFHPKPEDCKAKTAKLGSLAGLVVSPNHVRSAFSDIGDAQKYWNEFRSIAFKEYGTSKVNLEDTRYSSLLPQFYDIELSDKKYYGALKMLKSHPKNETESDCYIHSDFDLMALFLRDERGISVVEGTRGNAIARTRNNSLVTPRTAPVNTQRQFTSEEIRAELNNAFGITVVNTDIRVNLIQHGHEFEYSKGLGAASSEEILCFEPETITSFMSNMTLQ